MAVERTFACQVDGVGDFTFRKRTFRHQFELEGAAERITGGPVSSEGLAYFASAVATFEVLMVDAPKGFSVDDLDPLDPASFELVQKVFKEFRAAEQRFRDAAHQ